MTTGRTLALPLMMLLLTSAAIGQEANQGFFENKLYSISEFKHFGLDPQQFAALTDSDKKNLLAARNALIGLLRAIETNSSVSPFVADQFLKRYKNNADLVASLIEPETSIHAAGISDFKLVKPGEIHFHFFAVVFSEGNLAVAEKSATIEHFETGWRVAAIE